MPSTGERLLSIGEFSRLSQLSVRMLRYYDEHGVLHPTRVDGHSGCRSYSPALPSVARWVRLLRDIGLGVHEIAACVPVLGDRRGAKDPPHTRQSPPALAAFRPWGSSAR